MASARVQHWALNLSAYEYKIQYVSGKDNANTAVLSCLPSPLQPKEVPIPEELVTLLESSEISTVTVPQIKHWTDHDPVLAKVRNFVYNDWPRSINSEFQPFYSRRLELSIQDNCLLWGSHVIIPQPGKEKILSLLHEGHPGICKMKSLACNFCLVAKD